VLHIAKKEVYQIGHVASHAARFKAQEAFLR